MTESATMTLEHGSAPAPQRMRALERANAVRLARAELKRRIARGHLSAAEVILDLPEAASTWPVGELLMSQRRWGSNRTRKLLSGLQISEMRHLGKLTERQRRLLAAQLGTRAIIEEPQLCQLAVIDPPRLGPVPDPLEAYIDRNGTCAGEQEEPHRETGDGYAGAHDQDGLEYHMAGVVEAACLPVGAVEVA
jgi:hypothetical protein